MSTVQQIGPWKVTLHPPVLVYRGGRDEHITRPNLCKFQVTLGLLMQTTFDSHGTHHDRRHVAVSYDDGESWQMVAKNVEIGSFSIFSKPNGEVVTLPHDSIRFGPTRKTFGGTRSTANFQDGQLTIAYDETVAAMPKEIMGYLTDRPSSGEASHIIAAENKPIAYFWGTIVQLRDGRWICPAYCTFADDPRLPDDYEETAIVGLGKFTCFLLVSSDEGRTWQWLCTVATPRDVPDECCEGADEQQFYEYDDRWRVIFRTGALHTATPMYSTESFDEGVTWTKPQPLQNVDGAIDPRGLMMPDGTTVLATGRPGSDIYLAEDSSLDFHKIDIVAHHNSCLPDAKLDTYTQWGLPWFFPNTSHTDVWLVEPSKLLFTYDRVPDGWRWEHTGFTAPDEIYTVMLEIEHR